MSEMDTLFAECAYDYLAFEGSDAVDLLGRLSTGDLRPLHQPMVTGLTAFTTNQGKMLDWCTALSTADGLMLRCSQGRGAKIKEWIEQYIIMEDSIISINRYIESHPFTRVHIDSDSPSGAI